MSIYDFKVQAADGSQVDLNDYRGQVLVIVNTASKCGFTPQFDGLEKLYQQYKDQGFTVLGFPCNQFRNQDPGSNDEIVEFCQVNYGVTFPDDGQDRRQRQRRRPGLPVADLAGQGFPGLEVDQVELHEVPDRPRRRGPRAFGSQDEPEKMAPAIEAALQD